MLDYVRFREAISIGGDLGAIDSWSRDKHANQVEVEEKGNYLILHILKTTDTPIQRGGETIQERSYVRTGVRRRVPITTVSYLTEHDDTEKKK